MGVRAVPIVSLVLALLSPGCLLLASEAGEDLWLERPVHAWATAEMGLVEALPARSAAVATGGFFRAWAEGDDYPTWRAEPAPRDLLVTGVSVHLVVRATGPVVETARFPDIMVYAGGGESWLGYGSAQTEGVLVPGRTYEFPVDVQGPEGGLWVPRGEQFGVKVVPVMLQEDGADVEVLVGPQGSTVSWHQAPLGAEPRPAVSERVAGTVAGSAYAGEAAPETTSARYPVSLPGDATAFLAWMNVTANEGVPDVDLSLEREDGTVVAFSGTPTPREHLKLAGGAIQAPGDHVIVVTSYGSARASFTLEWAIG